MKKQILIAVCVLFGALQLSAQDCDKLLADGLYSFTKMTNTGSFSMDLRTYFLSESFRSDLKSGKWGGSVTVPVKGVPVSFGMNDSNEQYAVKRQKILETTELKIESGFAQVMLQSVPNTNLYEAYVKCVEIGARKEMVGLFQGTNVETEDAVVFTFYYRPLSPGDGMPKVTGFNVMPAGSVVGGALVVGDVLTGFTTLITCKRPVDQDLILTLQTDRGAITSKASAQENLTSSKELPIGTIVTSYLNMEQFALASKNNEKSPGGIWTSGKSRWAPCDGRNVPNSKFQTITSKNRVPDLRGRFLRGLNRFDPYQPVADINPAVGDPENRTVGDYQRDAFQGHKHFADAQLVKRGDNDLPNSPDQRPKQRYSENSAGVHDAGYGVPRVDVETRPKNVAVYYYIKIN